jgi:hypothetical protein
MRTLLSFYLDEGKNWTKRGKEVYTGQKFHAANMSPETHLKKGIRLSSG